MANTENYAGFETCSCFIFLVPRLGVRVRATQLNGIGDTCHGQARRRLVAEKQKEKQEVDISNVKKMISVAHERDLPQASHSPSFYFV